MSTFLFLGVFHLKKKCMGSRQVWMPCSLAFFLQQEPESPCLSQLLALFKSEWIPLAGSVNRKCYKLQVYNNDNCSHRNTCVGTTLWTSSFPPDFLWYLKEVSFFYPPKDAESSMVSKRAKLVRLYTNVLIQIKMNPKFKEYGYINA